MKALKTLIIISVVVTVASLSYALAQIPASDAVCAGGAFVFFAAVIAVVLHDLRRGVR